MNELPQMTRAHLPARTAHRRKFKPARFTATAISSLKPEKIAYDLTDPGCAGLKIRIEPTGTKHWLFRFYWANQRQHLSLGAWPETGLAQARANSYPTPAERSTRASIRARQASRLKNRRPPPCRRVRHCEAPLRR